MKGRFLAWGLAALLLLALAVQAARWHGRLLASQLVRQVQLIALSAARSNPAALERLLPYNLAALRRAGAGDPVAVEVPLARGSLYLLLARAHQRPEEAAEAAESYRLAIALEPHPEIYLHLGEALLAAGRLDEARRSDQIAVRLDPWLRASIPAGIL